MIFFVAFSLFASAQCPVDSLDFSWKLTNNCQPVFFVPYVNFGVAPYTYKWYFGDNSNSPDNKLMKPLHVYVDSVPAPVAYTVVLIVTDSKNNVCSISKIILVQPSPILIADSTLNLTNQFVHCIVQGTPCELDVVNRSPFKNSHYTINWGDGNIFDNNVFPKVLSHTYPTSNQYEITASTTNGCLSYNFFCGSNPAGGIACPANRLACAGLQLDFPIDSKTLENPPGTTYVVSFQDGTNDLVLTQETLPPVISHVFTGNMSCIPLKVQMRATNPCGFTESTCSPINITTVPNPDIGFTKNTKYDCANLTKYTFKNATTPCCIKIDGTVDNRVALKWSITPNTYNIVDMQPDSSTFTVIFLKVDCYTVHLGIKYQNINCRKCGDTNVVKLICLDSLPNAKAKPDVSDNYIDCGLPLKVLFTNASTNATSYIWSTKPNTTDPFWSVDFANGTNKNSVNPYIQFNQVDTFNVILSAINNCGASDFPLQIITKSPPVIKIDKPLSFCGPDSFDLTIDDNSVNIQNVNPNTKYSWAITPPVGMLNNTSNSRYPTFTFNSGHLKTYMLKVTIDNNNGCLPVSDSTLMNFTDKPSISLSSDTNNICDGDTVKLFAVDNSINNGKNILFKWSQSDTLGGLSSTTGTTVTVKPKVTTTFTVKGYVKNDTLCKDILSITIVVKPQPVIKLIPLDTNICSGESVILSVSGGVSYIWSPVNSTNSSLSVTPLSNTTYTVTATGFNNCKTTVSSTINVKPFPELSFISKSIEFVNTDITFLNTSINSVSYSWTFGDGNNSQDILPIHKYGKTGNYTVKLSGTSDYGCSGDTSHIIKIIKTIPFSLLSDSGCSPFTVNFINNSIDPELKYFWDFGYKNLTSTLPDPGAITYSSNSDTIFNVSCFLIYNTDTIKATVNIHIFTKPSSNFTSEPHCGCPVLAVNFTNRSISALQYSCKWDFGDGNSIFETDNMSHSLILKNNYKGKPLDSTYYTVTLTDSNKCGVSIFKDTITVFPDNIIVDFIPDKSVVCMNEVIHFINKSKFYNSLYWDFGDSSKSSAVNPSHIYLYPGVYNVKLTAFNQCLNCGGTTSTGSSSFSYSVKINKIPEIDFTIDNKTFCQDEAVSFTSITQDALSDIYWDFGDPASGSFNTSNSVSPSHIYNNPGTYIVKFIGKSLSANPCIDSIKKPVTINVKPVSAFVDSSFCQFSETQFINHSLNYDNSFWLFGDGEFSNEINPKHIYKNSGDFVVNLTVSNSSACTDSYFSNITIYPFPKADFSYVSINDNHTNTITATFLNNSSDSCNYFWNFGDGTFSNEKHPIHTYNTITSFVAKLIVTNKYGCIAEIEKIILPEAPSYYFYVPNAFTPGSSTLNNTFYPVITLFSSYHMKIFDRWGGMIFETFDYNEHWDGKYGGKYCPDGTYVYIIEVRDNSALAETHTYYGRVTLLGKK